MKQTKSYFANTVEEALALARQEFGDEALLIESRRTGGENRRGGYEVLVAAPEAPAEEAPLEGSGGGALAGEMTALRRELERMADLLGHLARNTVGLRQAEMAPLAAELARADLAPELIQRVMQRIAPAARGAGGAPQPLLRQAAFEYLRDCLRCEPRIGKPGAGRRIMALAGPPGAGKTTTLVKLAMRYGIGERVPTAIITTDTYRIAAADQLKSYAAILGLPCLVVEHAAGLANALEEFRNKDLVLIDTPGFSAGDWDLAADWARYLLAQEHVDTQLVISAAVRAADVGRLLGQWCAFAPQALIFTHLDETEATGGALTAAIETGLPVSFLGTGQSVPEDLEPACAEALLKFLAAPRAARGAAA